MPPDSASPPSMRQLLRSAVVLCGVLVAPRTLPAQTVLRGRLYDVYTQAPVGGGAVSADNQETTTTDRDGAFTLPCRPNMSLTVKRVGYSALHVRVTDCTELLQIGLSPSAQTLNQVSVVDTRESAGRSALDQPQSVTTLSRSELRRGTGLFFDESLNLVPGVRFERRTMSGGQRITIRGYGTRSNFDGSGYKAYLNGIPLTDAEGVTVLDDVDFGSIGRVDVVRGPASSLFGAGIAGVVNLWTLRPERLGTTIEQETMGGQDGLLRSDTRYATASATSTVLVNFGHQQYDSYRLHSASKKDFATVIGDFRPSERRTITTFLSYANSRDERAGQIDSAAFFGKRNVGEAPYLANNAHVNMETLRVGVTHGYRVNDMFEPVVTAFMSGTTREDVFAAGVTPKSIQTFGTRAVLNVRLAPGGRALTGANGVEFEQSNVFVKGYRYTNAVLGALTNDLETRSTQISAFSQWDLALPANFVLTAGASVNGIEYTLDDRLANTANPTRKSISGRKTYDPVVVPRVALRRRFGDMGSIYGTVSQGFTPATSSDAVIQFTGQPNGNLDPERGTLYEVGAKGLLTGSRLAYQVALYDLRVSDKLTSQSVFDANGTQPVRYPHLAGPQ
ncbi:MAG: TonB-dependent receptor, partial [Gemmatimonadaceae bacterium]|nr:TonB-dependent receptor [Gemmatimonadaceae bacterium]